MKIYYDLHLHSCLSPCGDNEMTPYNLVNMAKICGFDVIALTDHNSCLNCESAMRVGREIGIEVIAGMELCTSEEIHVVCLFGTLENAMSFSRYVKENSPKIPNREKVFGEQLIMSETDDIIGKEDVLLTMASGISIEDVPTLVGTFDGIAYPAHIDRASYSIISNLGDFPSNLEFSTYELANVENQSELEKKYPHLEGKTVVCSSDAHYLESFKDKKYYFELENNKAETIINFLKKG